METNLAGSLTERNHLLDPLFYSETLLLKKKKKQKKDDEEEDEEEDDEDGDETVDDDGYQMIERVGVSNCN